MSADPNQRVEGNPSPSGQPAPNGAATPPAGNQPDQPDAAELQRQVEHERTLRLQAERDRDVWFQRYQQQPPTPTAAPPPQQREEEFDPSGLTLVDVVAANDVGALQKVIQAEARKLVKAELAGSGYVSKDQMDVAVAEKVQEIQSANQLMAEYPELQNPDSPLRNEVSRQLQLVEANPYYKNLPPVEQARIAVTQAQVVLFRSGQMQQPSGQSVPSRDQMIAAQQGQFRSTTGSTFTEGNDELTPGQKYFAQMFNVSEEKYKAEQKRIQSGRR